VRKFISILFLAILVFANVGYIGLYAYQQNLAKEKMTNKILAGHFAEYLVTIDAAQNQIKWVEANEEFTLNGKLYDVVKIEIKDGHTIMQCISDTDEANIVNEARKATEKNSQSTTLAQFFKLFTADKATVYSQIHFLEIRESIYNLFPTPSLDIAKREILSPPPQFV
jgi:hypothetical protein